MRSRTSSKGVAPWRKMEVRAAAEEKRREIIVF